MMILLIFCSSFSPISNGMILKKKLPFLLPMDFSRMEKALHRSAPLTSAPILVGSSVYASKFCKV